MTPPAWSRHLPPGMSTFDPLEGESVTRRWAGVWAGDGDKIVIEDLVTGASVAAGGLEQLTREVARGYAGLGLEPGDRLILSGEASTELIVRYVAALRLGLVVVPVNTAYTGPEVVHIVANTTPKLALVDNDDQATAVAESSGGECAVLGVADDLPAGGDVELDTATRNTPALICHTSGTTGKPKGAMLSQGNLLASAEAVRVAWRWEPDDKLALSLPLFHVHGLGVGVNGTLTTGATMVLTGPFEPDAVARAVEEADATMFFGVPTMYHRLADSAVVDRLARLRLCVSGSAPLPAALHQALAQSCGQQVLERYGMTETLMNVSNPHDGERRPGTVGFPLPGVEVRLDVAPGEEMGEIHVRGPNVFPGYWNDPAATEAIFTDDGWLMTGDIGRHDDDGYLCIAGRSKDLIISGGFNVYPREVEDVILACPGVAEVAVVGVPSDEWGESVTAFVVAEGQADGQRIIDFAGSRLARFKQPRAVHFVDDLPRNPLGKVLRHELVRDAGG